MRTLAKLVEANLTHILANIYKISGLNIKKYIPYIEQTAS